MAYEPMLAHTCTQLYHNQPLNHCTRRDEKTIFAGATWEMLFSTGEKELFWGLLSVRRQYCSRQKAFLEKTHKHISLSKAGWQKFREGTKGLRRKVKTQKKILSPNIRYFVAILRFVAIYALFAHLSRK